MDTQRDRLGVLDRGALRLCLAPLGEAQTLPGLAYNDPGVFEWEQDTFFESSWVCLGRSSDLPATGDHKAIRVGSETVLVVRDGAEINAFFNVCRHRGHELLETGTCANARAIKCPYHGWVYGLDGSLKGAPRYSEIPGFDAAAFSLTPLRVQEWNGWVFVNASGDAPDFSGHAGSLDGLTKDHECGRLVTVARHDYLVEANWKIVTENYHECYHCPQIHPELCRVTSPDSGTDDPSDGAWAGGSMDLFEHAVTMSMTGESGGKILRGLDAGKSRRVYYYSLWPNLLISLHPDYVMTHRLEPLGPDRTRLECEWLFAPEVATEGFDPSYAVDFWDVTNREDWGACESVQRGTASRAYRQGPLSMVEGTTHQFIAMVAAGYLESAVVPAGDLVSGLL
ncbi:MAG: glycine betaine catabolism [Actinomycetota bacterium]|nr:glycine betaine catabolism [Actinomycetota bacterium]